MTPAEKQKMDESFSELTKHERRFLEEQRIIPNEHGAFVFTNQDGSCMISLDLFLRSYREHLIDNKIVKER